MTLRNSFERGIKSCREQIKYYQSQIVKAEEAIADFKEALDRLPED